MHSCRRRKQEDQYGTMDQHRRPDQQRASRRPDEGTGRGQQREMAGGVPEAPARRRVGSSRAAYRVRSRYW